MSLRADPDLALGPGDSVAQLLHLGMVVRRVVGQRQARGIEDPRLRAESLQQARALRASGDGCRSARAASRRGAGCAACVELAECRRSRSGRSKALAAMFGSTVVSANAHGPLIRTTSPSSFVKLRFRVLEGYPERPRTGGERRTPFGVTTKGRLIRIGSLQHGIEQLVIAQRGIVEAEFLVGRALLPDRLADRQARPRRSLLQALARGGFFRYSMTSGSSPLAGSWRACCATCRRRVVVDRDGHFTLSGLMRCLRLSRERRSSQPMKASAQGAEQLRGDEARQVDRPDAGKGVRQGTGDGHGRVGKRGRGGEPVGGA